MNELDVIIIGGGAAGLSAAIVLARARRTVLVVDSGNPRNAPAVRMHGFLSRDGMPPAELLDIGRNELVRYGGTVVRGEVSQITLDASGFRLVLAPGGAVTARRVLVATGLQDVTPDIPGLRERWARDVLHCPYCHGFEVRDQRLAVLGGSAQAVTFTQIVRQWSADVTYITPSQFLPAGERERLLARGIDIAEGAPVHVLVENDHLIGVELDDGRTVTCDAVFVPPRFIPNNALLRDLGCDMDDDGWVRTDDTGLTSIPGVWAAGNVANPRAQVITAAGEGSAAAIAINADLVGEDIRTALSRPESGNADRERGDPQ
jgi:thioredoxin reductase